MGQSRQAVYFLLKMPLHHNRRGDPCNRSSCRAPGADHWNVGMYCWYCWSCARKINEGSPALVLFAADESRTFEDWHAIRYSEGGIDKLRQIQRDNWIEYREYRSRKEDVNPL